MNDPLKPSALASDERVAGAAALSICESLLITLNDLKIIDDKCARGVFVDAAETHRTASTVAKDPELHHAVAALITQIMDGKNSVRKF